MKCRKTTIIKFIEPACGNAIMIQPHFPGIYSSLKLIGPPKFASEKDYPEKLFRKHMYVGA